ncbi:MAG: DNA polymerase III subunit epsilon [Chromatiales bacterium]|jgi:DNA polymerase-3 subunit epsilon|nr:DNA polymerase III subunit epsilon [Chromatiales bacterium]
MRQIVLDTETTGLEPAQGHRIIEIGCVEIIDRRLTGNHFHHYLQPDRDIDAGAQEVHGITAEFLRDKPGFNAVADDLFAFVDGAELIIHNAPFDLAFLRRELELLGRAGECFGADCAVIDTLVMARNLHPGQKNSLDALCRRYDIDNSQRELHGALLDAEILADVYLAMTGGQSHLVLERERESTNAGRSPVRRLPAGRPPLPVLPADERELVLHRARIEAIERQSGAPSLWSRLGLG